MSAPLAGTGYTPSMTTIGGLILAIWLVVWSQTSVSTTFSLIMGLIAGVCFLLDLFGVSFPATRRAGVP